MTRDEYERHLDGLGSWAELLPGWQVVEAEMSEPDTYCCPNCTAVWQGCTGIASECRRINTALDRAQAIARTLLHLTSLTPSQVRAEWPEEAEWLLESEP